MRRLISFVLVLVLSLCSLGLGEPAIYSAEKNLGVVEGRSTLDSENKKKLRLLNTGGTVNNSFVLLLGERFKVLQRAQFKNYEQIMDTEKKVAHRTMPVRYDCAYVVVLNGPHRGKKGWTLLARDVTGVYVDHYASPYKSHPNDDE